MNTPEDGSKLVNAVQTDSNSTYHRAKIMLEYPRTTSRRPGWPAPQHVKREANLVNPELNAIWGNSETYRIATLSPRIPKPTAIKLIPNLIRRTSLISLFLCYSVVTISLVWWFLLCHCRLEGCLHDERPFIDVLTVLQRGRRAYIRS